MKTILNNLKKAIAVGLTMTICLGQQMPALWAGDNDNSLMKGILNPQGTPSIHVEDGSEKIKNETSQQNLESPHDSFFGEPPLSKVKGRPFGSPPARGLKPRAGTASDTLGKPGAPSAVETGKVETEKPGKIRRPTAKRRANRP